MSDGKLGVRVVMTLVLVLSTAGIALAEGTQFDFNGGNLAATFGPGGLSYFNGEQTSAIVGFGTASSFGLPAMPGGDAHVVKFPAFANNQGFELLPATPPNGGGGDINQYTMIWDLLVPNIGSAGTYMGLMNTSPNNGNDGDFFIKSNGDSAGIGISSVYDGAIYSNQWHRVAVSIDLTASAMNKYIDGALVGTQTLSSGVGGRWSLYADGQKTLLLTDEDGETNAGYLSSFYFVDQALDSAAIRSMGGPKAGGIVPEPTSVAMLVTAALAGLFCWTRRVRRDRSV